MNATPLVRFSPPEWSISASSTRRMSLPGILASVIPVMLSLRRASSRTRALARVLDFSHQDRVGVEEALRRISPKTIVPGHVEL